VRRQKSLNVRVRAPSRGLVSRLPGESADKMPAQGGIAPGVEDRAASRASNVRYEDGVVCNAPGYEKVALQASALTGLVAQWSLDERSGDRADRSGNARTLSEVTGMVDAAGTEGGVGAEGGKFNLAARFAAVERVGEVTDSLTADIKLGSGALSLSAPTVQDSLTADVTLAEGALVSALCPVVTEYPTISWSGRNGPLMSGGFDLSRRELWLLNQAAEESVQRVSTVTNEYVTEYLQPINPQLPFGQCSMVFDPVNDVLVLVGQYYGYEALNPTTGAFNFAGLAAFAGNGGYNHLACDTSRGNTLLVGDAGDEGKQFEIGTTSTAGVFTHLHTSAVIGAVKLGAPCYSDGADKFVIVVPGSNPPLYYVDPVSYAVTASTLDLTAIAAGHCFALAGTSYIAFAKTDGYVVIVDASTDTVFDSSVYAGALQAGVYNSCTNTLYVSNISTGVTKIDLASPAAVLATAQYCRVLQFDPFAGLVYGATTGTAPHVILTL